MKIIYKATDSHDWINNANKMYIIGPNNQWYLEQYPNLISVLYRALTAFILQGDFNFGICKLKRNKDGYWY